MLVRFGLGLTLLLGVILVLLIELELAAEANFWLKLPQTTEKTKPCYQVNECISYFQNQTGQNSAYPWLQLSLLYWQSGDHNLASESLETAKEIDPAHPDIKVVENLIY